MGGPMYPPNLGLGLGFGAGLGSGLAFGPAIAGPENKL